jgi:hypothetical protein
VGETLSTPEVAHAIGHHHGKTQSEQHALRARLGLIALSGCLLAVALYYVMTYPVA